MESKEELPATHLSHNLSSHVSLTNLPQNEQVEKLHVIYHEQEETLSDIRDELRRKYVPASECKHVEMCINDVEVLNCCLMHFNINNIVSRTRLTG